MLELKKVAITGGLSCGKSTVSRIFRELGAYVVSADEIVHKLLTPDTNLGQQVIQLLGPEIVAENKIDRACIAKKVFNQPGLLLKLEALLHPAVRETMQNLYEVAKQNSNRSLFIAEIPLLFEANSLDAGYDAVIAVIADPETCKKRFVSNGFSADEYEKRMARQMSMKEKAERADFVITNDGTEIDLRESVKKIYDQLVV